MTMTNKTKRNNKVEFKWNVWNWNFNSDRLEQYDVVPVLLDELKRLKKDKKPKTKKEFSGFLNSEAQYHFWSKCEYEMIVHDWPTGKRDEKVDVYDQLLLNWGHFVDAFWKFYRKVCK